MTHCRLYMFTNTIHLPALLFLPDPGQAELTGNVTFPDCLEATSVPN